MKERIIKVMEHEGLGQAQFAAAIGIQRAAMSHIISGRNNPSLDVMLKILHRFPYINPDWLLFGKDEMLRDRMANPDLFRDAPASLPEIQFASEAAPEISVEESVVDTPEEEEKGLIIQQEKASKSVSRIMVFYSDNTYETFVPEKSNNE